MFFPPPSQLPSLATSDCLLSLRVLIFYTIHLSSPPTYPLHSLSLYPLSGLFTEVSAESPSLSNPLLSFPLHSSVDSYTLRWDQSDQSSCPHRLSFPLLLCVLDPLFSLDAAETPLLLLLLCTPLFFLTPLSPPRSPSSAFISPKHFNHVLGERSVLLHRACVFFLMFFFLILSCC